MPDNTPDPSIIKLENVRLSYPHLFVPAKALEAGKEEKYQATFLLDKTKHATLIKKIEALTDRLALDKFHKKIPLKHKPLRDGGAEDMMDKEGYGDEVTFIRSSSDKRPVVVDRDLTPLTKDDPKPYAGCYVNATIRLFAYEHPTGGRGVSCGLRAVQFVKDGDSFGAGPVKAEDEFTAVEDNDDI